MKKICILLFILAGVFVICSLTFFEKPKDVEKLDVWTLIEDVGDNPAAAANKYDKNYYEITLHVAKIEKNRFTAYYKRAADSKMYTIDVFMSQDELAKVKKDIPATIIGKVYIGNSGNIKIKKATLY